MSYFGRRVIRAEQAYFDNAVREMFGYFAVQIGMPQVNLLRRCPINCCARIGLSSRCDVRAAPSSLPFREDSVDLAVISHVLEFTGDPHGVLREVARVLRPEGRIALSMFNPHSLLGLKCLTDMTGEFPYNAGLISLAKIKDWLRLLDFVLEGGKFSVYMPPGTRRRSRKLYRWMEYAGDRWWPLGGSVFFLIARKRVAGMNMITPRWAGKPKRHNRLAVAS